MHAQKGEKVKEMTVNRNDTVIIIKVMHSLELRECPAVLEQLADGSCACNTDVVPAKAVQQNTGRGGTDDELQEVRGPPRGREEEEEERSLASAL
jgi:hypothetical protein